MAWPPILDDLKDDEDIPLDDDIDDDKLQRRLDAAVSFAERVRSDAFVTDDAGVPVQPVTYSEQGDREAAALELGTMLLASRLFARRRSRDAVLWMAETGTTHIPFNDPEIEHLLRIGRHELPKVG